MGDNTHTDVANSIDTNDARWYDALGMAAVAFGASMANVALSPGIIEAGISIGLLAVFGIMLFEMRPNDDE